MSRAARRPSPSHHRPPEWWGWHRLDPRWARRLVADAHVAPGSLVLDIGAGSGALTRPLLDAGARVIAIEAHAARARQLRETFGESIVVVQADAADLRLPRRAYSVVANPPFAIATALLRRLLQPGSRLIDAHLILPDHAAKRWTSAAAPGMRRWGQTFRVELGPRIPQRAFHPPPRSRSGLRVLVIRRIAS